MKVWGNSMFEVHNDKAHITGDKGAYDRLNNSSIKYGRNAVSNHFEYSEQIKSAALDLPDLANLKGLSEDEFAKKVDEASSSLDKKDNSPPLNLVMKYLPQNVDYKNLDKLALLGAAFEEMGKKLSISVDEMTSKLQSAFGKNVSAKAVDVNNDGQIDVGEYATTILIEDMLGENQNALEAKNINGEITSDGQKASAIYINQTNYAEASKEYKAIHESFGLEAAKNEFLKTPQ